MKFTNCSINSKVKKITLKFFFVDVLQSCHKTRVLWKSFSIENFSAKLEFFWKRIKKAESFVLPSFLTFFFRNTVPNCFLPNWKVEFIPKFFGHLFFSFLILPPENVVAESKSKLIKVVAKSINKLWFDRQSFPVVAFFLFELITLSATVLQRIACENSSPPRLPWRSRKQC